MKLSDREWTVLNALWDSGGAGLGELVKRLRPETGWSRNTVLTYLTRMEAKGLVRIDSQAVPHLYRAALDRDACRAQEGRSFLNSVYRGSAGDLIAAFLKQERISPQELERLRKLLDEMEV
ncbi:MAG: BlaI/MecI/CopY family transcriptional regulator [Oscillospiraceae bacterium]|nr:BlaI/MecI/CopY family transcriptional regulator [Oscillospiraceae bacterium]